MKRGEIRDIVITGSFMIGSEGEKEPVHGWEDYARKLEDILIENGGSLPTFHTSWIEIWGEWLRADMHKTDVTFSLWLQDNYNIPSKKKN